MTKKQAEALWADLRDAFASVETIIARIIETRAWEPLGYATFTEAWADRMPGVEVRTTESKAAVVYQMVDDGATDTEIALTVKGLGTQSVKALRSQKSNNVPPKRAQIKVRQHFRVPPREAYRLHCQPTSREYDQFTEIAKREGMTNEQALLHAVQIVIYRNGFE